MNKISALVLTVILAGSLNVYSQGGIWQVAPENSNNINPVAINPKGVANGKNIYFRSCVPCHGPKADGKGLIQSANLLAEPFQHQTDGVIFYKINKGRDKMPPFEAMLKADEIWLVINYLRVIVNPSALPPAKDVRLEVNTGDEIKSVTASVYGSDSTKSVVKEIDVHFYVKRDFGLMRIGEQSNFTGADGKVTVILPEKIIGDALGNITILAKIENNFLFNDAESAVVRKWGTPLVTDDEKFNQRALWGSRDKSPIWLLLLANGIILVVWGVIGYVVYNLFRIKKAGEIFIK